MDIINPISTDFIKVADSNHRNDVSFADWITTELREIDSSVKGVEDVARRVVSGDIENLHQVMSRISEAELKLQFALQVRDKAIEAYKEVLRMQL